jgi:hypothetical protein
VSVQKRSSGRPKGTGTFTDRLEVRLREGEKASLEQARLRENQLRSLQSRLVSLSAFIRHKLGLEP